MKVKLLCNTLLPKKGRQGDAGFDVFSPISGIIHPGERLQVKLGLSLEFSPDEVCLVTERSGMAIKHGIHSIGPVIDSNYRGEISAILQNSGKESYSFNEGDRICQLLLIKLGDQSIEEVDSLSDTERGESAHYSSGK